MVDGSGLENRRTRKGTGGSNPSLSAITLLLRAKMRSTDRSSANRMAKRANKTDAPKIPDEPLKGWKQIADFLGEPASVVQRWASEGMPVRRQGRYVESTPAELNLWLGKESGKPVHVATEDTDLTAELKRGLSFVQQEKLPGVKKRPVASPKRVERK